MAGGFLMTDGSKSSAFPRSRFLYELWLGCYLKGFLVIDLVNTISKLRLDLDQEDKIFWPPSSMGEFSITSAWSALRPRKDPIVIHQIVCCPILLLKLSFFA